MWRVLLIDDEPKMLERLKKWISWDEFDAVCVGEGLDGRQGLELVHSLQPDIVVTDIYMPVMNGLDMIAHLRTNGYAGAIIILSGYTDFEYARQALRLEVEDYLSKPLSLDSIHDVMRRTVQKLQEKEIRRAEQEDLRRKLSMYQPYAEREWLKALLTGPPTSDVPPPPVPLPLAGEDGTWDDYSYLAMAVELERLGRGSDLNTKDYSLFQFAVTNMLEELLREHWPASRLVELYSYHLSVLLMVRKDLSEQEARAQAERLRTLILEAAERYLRVHLRIGLGGVQSFTELRQAVEEAFVELIRGRMGGEDRTPVGETAAAGAKARRSPSLGMAHLYRELAQAVTQQSEADALCLIQSLPARLRSQSHGEVTPYEVRMSAVELWTMWTHTLYDAGIKLSELFTERAIDAEIAALETPEELAQWLAGRAKEIIERMAKNENIRHKQAVDFMIKYIHEHYAEDLRIGDLSEKTHISKNYLGSIFRHMMGESFNDYLTRVRIEKAKSLLLEGRYLVYEVADKIGYRNVTYFATLFKKLTGISPSDFGRKL